MAATFLQACKSLYGTIAGVPTLYLDEAPPNVAYPRCVVTHGGENPILPSEHNELKNPTISEATATFEFQVENNSDDAETIAILLMDAFKPDALVLTMDSTATLLRQDYQVGLQPYLSPAQLRVYYARVSYRAMFGTDY